MVKVSKQKPIMLQRTSALARVAVAGVYGANKAAPGIVLRVVHPLSIVAVIARKGKSRAVKRALDGLRGCMVLWAGPDQYFVQRSELADVSLLAELSARLSGLASITDQSHGRVVVGVSGSKVRHLLAKGTPVDLHADEFAVGACALTQMAHVGVHLTRVGEDAFELSVFRGFSESFWDWLTSQAVEFGYQVI